MMADSTLLNGMTIPLEISCACRAPKRMPVRLDVMFWSTMNQLLSTVDVDPEIRVFTVYCRHCGTEKEISIGDLDLDNKLDRPHMLG